MEHAYKDLEVVDCYIVNLTEKISECIIQVTPDKPLTGW